MKGIAVQRLIFGSPICKLILATGKSSGADLKNDVEISELIKEAESYNLSPEDVQKLLPDLINKGVLFQINDDYYRLSLDRHCSRPILSTFNIANQVIDHLEEFTLDEFVEAVSPRCSLDDEAIKDIILCLYYTGHLVKNYRQDMFEFTYEIVYYRHPQAKYDPLILSLPPTIVLQEGGTINGYLGFLADLSNFVWRRSLQHSGKIMPFKLKDVFAPDELVYSKVKDNHLSSEYLEYLQDAINRRILLDHENGVYSFTGNGEQIVLDTGIPDIDEKENSEMTSIKRLLNITGYDIKELAY